MAHLLNSIHDLRLDVDLGSLFKLLPNMDGPEADPGKDVSAYAYAEQLDVPLLLSSHLPFEERLFSRRPIVFLLRSRRPAKTAAGTASCAHSSAIPALGRRISCVTSTAGRTHSRSRT
jgi:hypothetical protein